MASTCHKLFSDHLSGLHTPEFKLEPGGQTEGLLQTVSHTLEIPASVPGPLQGRGSTEPQDRLPRAATWHISPSTPFPSPPLPGLT